MADNREMVDDRYDTDYPPCMYCIHRTESGEQSGPIGWKCKAYPEQIPPGILSREWKHDEVYDNQEGDYTFESVVEEFEDGKHVITWEGEWVKV